MEISEKLRNISEYLAESGPSVSTPIWGRMRKKWSSFWWPNLLSKAVKRGPKLSTFHAGTTVARGVWLVHGKMGDKWGYTHVCMWSVFANRTVSGRSSMYFGIKDPSIIPWLWPNIWTKKESKNSLTIYTYITYIYIYIYVPPANSLWEIREHVLHIKCNFRLHFAFLGNLVVDSIEPRFSASDSIEGLL